MDAIMEKYEKAKEHYQWFAVLAMAALFFLAEHIPHTLGIQWMEAWPWQESIADRIPIWINNANFAINSWRTKGIAIPLSFISALFLTVFWECETRWKIACNTILALSMLAAGVQFATTIRHFSFFG